MKNILKKSIVAVSLCSVGLVAVAGDTVASMSETTPKPVLELATLVNIRNELTSLHAAVLEASHSTAAHSCKYEDKTYSEGAIKQVGKVALLCVRPSWGTHNIRLAGQGDALAEVALVWEPLSSGRLEEYRVVTRVPVNSK